MTSHLLFDISISERSDGYLFSTALVKAGNKYRRENGLKYFYYYYWLKDPVTKSFISELRAELNCEVIISKPLVGTWMHPVLFLYLACQIIPFFETSEHNWLRDTCT